MAPPRPSCWPVSPAAVERQVGITVSIGLAANRLMAKIAAGRGKPRGFTVIDAEEAASPAGAGKRPAVARRRSRHGTQAGDHRDHPAGTVASTAGSRRHTKARRRWARPDPSRSGSRHTPRQPAREAKSVSAETTFDHDLSTVAELERPLWRLCEKLARRLKEQNLAAGGVVLKLKTSRFALTNQSGSLIQPDGAARPSVRPGTRVAGQRGDRHGVSPDRDRREPVARGFRCRSR